jgi:phage protein U
MSIGVLSGTTKDGQLVEVVFESYYQASVSDSGNLFTNWLSQKFGISRFSSSSKSADTFKVLTFDNLQRDGAGRWATHEIIGQKRKPVLEFIGPDLENISFSVFLSSFLGVNPEAELKKLRTLRDSGVVCDFMIGNTAPSINQWVVKSMNETHKSIDGSGNLIVAAVNVSMTEYVKLPKEG